MDERDAELNEITSGSIVIFDVSGMGGAPRDHDRNLNRKHNPYWVMRAGASVLENKSRVSAKVYYAIKDKSQKHITVKKGDKYVKGTFYELTKGTGTSYRRRLYEPLGSGEDDEDFDDVEEQHFMPAECIFMGFPSEQEFFEKRDVNDRELLHISDDVNDRAMDLVAPGEWNVETHELYEDSSESDDED